MTWDCDPDKKYHSVGWMWAHCFGFEEECIEVKFRGADSAGNKVVLDVYRSWKDGYVTLIRSVGGFEYYKGRKRRWRVKVLGISGTGQWASAAVEICYEEVVPVPPDARFQYEIDFGINHPLAQKQRDEYAAAVRWIVVHEDPDCFVRLQAQGGGVDESWETGWLCQAVEYGQSPCAPLPWWICPWPSPETIYFRGECSCSNFQDNLQRYGIPCMHLIAAKAYYGGDMPYCPYKPCP